jgi:uncharacterized protein (TIGR02001 family)
MKKFTLLAAAVLSALSSLPQAEATPDNSLSYNIGAVSDYRYRGISQSRLNPALQGGVDYTHNPTGLYLGTWLSTIKWLKDDGGQHNLEWDIYGGKRGNITNSLSYDLGVLRYQYPGNDLNQITGFANANTTEVYGQLTYQLINLKYSHAITNLFGFPDSKNSNYVDLFSNISLADGYTLGLHVGRQKVENASHYSYTDWKIGVSKDLIGLTWSLNVIGSNADKQLYVTPDGEFTGRTSLVLSAVKVF